MSTKRDKKVILSGSEETLKPLITHIIAMNQLLEGKDIGNVYGIPIGTYQAERKFHPNIKLQFQQIDEEVDKEYGRVTGEIGFRVMGYTSETLTVSKITELANKIKSKFGKPPFVWAKGKTMFPYSDWSKGYQLQLLCASKVEARRVIDNVLEIQGHSFEAENFNNNNNESPDTKYPEKPAGTNIILEKPYKKVRRRPIANVQFAYAELHLHGMGEPVILYDLVGKSTHPLIPRD